MVPMFCVFLVDIYFHHKIYRRNIPHMWGGIWITKDEYDYLARKKRIAFFGD